MARVECLRSQKSQRPDLHKRDCAWRSLLESGRQHQTRSRLAQLGGQRIHPPSAPLARKSHPHTGTDAQVSHDGRRRCLDRCPVRAKSQGANHNHRQRRFFNLPPLSFPESPRHFPNLIDRHFIGIVPAFNAEKSTVRRYEDIISYHDRAPTPKAKNRLERQPNY